jgi:hypothetical protein
VNNFTPKFSIEAKVRARFLGHGIIKGIRITGKEGESIHSPWNYSIQYNIWTLDVNKSAANSSDRQHPEDPSTSEDWMEWKEWGWVSEEEILKCLAGA